MRIETLPFRWVDGSGTAREHIGTAYVPDPLPAHAVPLVYYAGYVADEAWAQPFVDLGMVVVTTTAPEPDEIWPHPNPVPRGPAMDLALLRVARSLPYVDDARVVVTGASAGGYMTLMLAAATFPLNGAFPLVPPVNLVYLLSCWRHDVAAISAPRPGSDFRVMAHPGSPDIQAMGDAVAAHYGEPGDGRLWLASPLAHLASITCPVATWFTTADALVPLPQVGGRLSPAVIEGSPAVYPLDPMVVCADDFAAAGRRSLLDELDPEDVEVVEVAVPDGTPLVELSNPTPAPAAVVAAPVPTKRWLVMIVDEGPPDEDIGHLRHAFGIDTTLLVLSVLRSDVSVDQLTLEKLRLLMDRHRGLDWMLGGDLDPATAAAEEADVVRGLRTYCSASPTHATHFGELWQQLPDRSRVLPEELVAELMDFHREAPCAP